MLYFNFNYISDPKRFNMMIHKALLKYGYSGFQLEILEYCNKSELMAKEQYYLDLLTPEYNILKKAGSFLGFVHSEETIAKFRKIGINRFYSNEHKAKLIALNKKKYESKEFLEMQQKDKKGENNPLFGKIKTASTLAKITKIVYVYNSIDNSLIGEFSTVGCSKFFKMGKDTLTKYLNNGLPYKNKIFSRKKL